MGHTGIEHRTETPENPGTLDARSARRSAPSAQRCRRNSEGSSIAGRISPIRSALASSR
jgi:hypothetical protein